MKHIPAYGALVKRAMTGEDTHIELPWWAFIVILVDIIVFLPVVLYVSGL